MNSIEELDLETPEQVALTEAFESRPTFKDMAYLKLLQAMEHFANDVNDIPPWVWQRIVWELDKKAKESGRAVDRLKAQVFWNYLKAFLESCDCSLEVSEEDCAEEARKDNELQRALIRQSKEMASDGFGATTLPTDEFGATAGCDCPACRMMRKAGNPMPQD